VKYLITGQWNYLSPFIDAIIDIFPRTNGIVHQAYLVGSELLIQFSCPSYHVSLQGTAIQGEGEACRLLCAVYTAVSLCR